MSEFKPSTETLPASDHHDEIVKITEARCASLREKCWKMRDLVKTYHAKRRDFEASIKEGTPGDLDEVMVSFRECSALERDILNIREKIEQTVADYNFGRDTHQRIYLSHTEEGLPIRVAKLKKIPLWGI